MGGGSGFTALLSLDGKFKWGLSIFILRTLLTDSESGALYSSVEDQAIWEDGILVPDWPVTKNL